MDLEKALYPDSGELVIVGGIASATILDAELDPIYCTFVNDKTVLIDTDKLTYVSLTLDNLKHLERLINQSEKYYNNETP